MRQILLAFAFLLTLQGSLYGQAAFGARLASGGGTGNYMLGEIHGRIRLQRSIHLAAGYDVMGGVWACPDSPVHRIRCGYDGNTIGAGVAFAPIDAPRVYGAVRAMIGRFERTGTYAGREYTGTSHGSATIGIDLEIRLRGPLRIAGGFLHRQIFDGLYRDAIGTFPHLTALSVGLTFAFAQRDPGQ
jgi:hypothetical protein